MTERTMGPIERELRAGFVTREWVWNECSLDAFFQLRSGAKRLGFLSTEQALLGRAYPDMFSEAIEAAEALGL